MLRKKYRNNNRLQNDINVIKRKCVIYIHGKGGGADEAEHYKPLFADCDVIGFDYRTQTPWEAKAEFANFFTKIAAKYEQICIVANSIGAFFAMHALPDFMLLKAYFISPIVNMEHLIENMLQWANVTEAELKQKEIITTEFGETLSWKYLDWVRVHPLNWTTPTHILYGNNDNLQSLKDIEDFAAKTGADVTVMQDGEHWFHTPEQMQFLDDWIANRESL